MLQLELYGISKDVAPELVIAVLQKYAPEKLMPVTDQQDLLRHCQRGNVPETWYWWHRCREIAPLQMPELFSLLEQKAKLEEQLQALTVKEEE